MSANLEDLNAELSQLIREYEGDLSPDQISEAFEWHSDLAKVRSD